VNKGLIFDIRRFTIHDGPGIRTTVFFKGCNLQCWWCHNPESQCFRPEETSRSIILDNKTFLRKEIAGTWMTVEEVMHEIVKDRVFYDESYGGVTLSGGEPLLQPVFLSALMDELKTHEINITLDTSGYSPSDDFRSILDKPDLFLFDVKILEDSDHLKYTGVSNRIILKNLLLLCKKEKKVILRFPVVPGITDSRKNIDGLKGLLGKIKEHVQEIDLLPYHPAAAGKYRRFRIGNRLEGLQDVKMEKLEELKKEIGEVGIKVKIGG